MTLRTRLGRAIAATLVVASATASVADGEPGAEPRRGGIGYEDALVPASPSAGGLAAVPMGGAPPPDVPGKKAKKREFLIAPIPMSNPTIGSGLGLVVGALFPMNRNDEQSPPSFAGLGGFKTDNGSWAVGFAHKAYLRHDGLRLLVGGGLCDLRYDFYGTGQVAGDAGKSVLLRQDGWAALVEGLARVHGRWYLGGRIATGDVNTRIGTDDASSDVTLPFTGDGIDVHVASAGIRTEWDTRDSQFAPTKGRYLEAGIDVSDSVLGSDFDFVNFTLAYNRYRSFGAKRVLAWRASTQCVGGDPPFFALALFGASSDLRGYAAGQYRDETLVATQVELRQKLPRRFGLVVFAGIGGVAPTYTQYALDELLPSAGVGLRWLAAKKAGVNLRVDYAIGQDSDAIYVGVGEAF